MRALRIFDWAYLRLIHLLAYFTIGLLMIVTAWISLEVFSRAAGFGSLAGVVDFTEYAIYAMALLAAPWVLHRNAHVRVEVLTELLPASLHAAIGLAASVASAAVCAILAYYAALNFIDSVQRNELIFGEIIIPEWTQHWQAPVAFALLAYGFLRQRVTAAHDSASADLIKE